MMDFLIFLVYNIMSYINRDNLTSFPICIPFVSFSCLIVPSNASSTVLKRSGDPGQPCLIFYFNGIALSFSSFKIMLAVGLLYPAFIMLRYVHSSIVFSRTFIMKALDFFVPSSFLHLLRRSCDFIVKSTYMIYCIYWLRYVGPTWNSWIKPSYLWWLIFLICACIVFTSILLKTSASVFVRHTGLQFGCWVLVSFRLWKWIWEWSFYSFLYNLRIVDYSFLNIW